MVSLVAFLHHVLIDQGETESFSASKAVQTSPSKDLSCVSLSVNHFSFILSFVYTSRLDTSSKVKQNMSSRFFRNVSA